MNLQLEKFQNELMWEVNFLLGKEIDKQKEYAFIECKNMITKLIKKYEDKTTVEK